MLEVLPVCPPSIQRQLIGILPEVATPQDHGHVLEQLQGLLESDVGFMAPVVECLGNMMLEPAVQVSNMPQDRAYCGRMQPVSRPFTSMTVYLTDCRLLLDQREGWIETCRGC